MGLKFKKTRTKDIMTPQTGFIFDVRPLTVEEVYNIKKSYASIESRTIERLNELIWSCIVKHPDNMKTYDHFLRMTTLRDRDALLYAIYVLSFGSEKRYRLGCLSCNQEQNILFDIDSMFTYELYPKASSVINSYKLHRMTGTADYDEEIEKSIAEKGIDNEDEEVLSLEGLNAPPEGMPEDLARIDDLYKEFFRIYDKMNDTSSNKMSPSNKMKSKKLPKPKQIKTLEDLEQDMKEKKEKNNSELEDILTRRIELRMPITDNVYVYLKQPVLFDEIDPIKKSPLINSDQLELITDCLSIDSIKEVSDNGEIRIINDYEEIIEIFVHDLVAGDRTAIINKVEEEFAPYKCDLVTTWKCEKCNFENPVRMDIVTLFFRSIQEF